MMRPIAVALNAIAVLVIFVASILLLTTRGDVAANVANEPEDLLIINLLASLLMLSLAASLLNLKSSLGRVPELIRLGLNVLLVLATGGLAIISLARSDPDWLLGVVWSLPYVAALLSRNSTRHVHRD